MFYILAAIGWSLAAWRWGDWKHWGRYHATILYLCLCDVFYYCVTAAHPLWRLEPVGMIHSHALAIVLELVVFSASMLMYLGRFPKGVWKSVAWIAMWVTIYSVLEGVMHLMGMFSYHNGWNFLDSIAFDVMAFTMVRFHYRHPLYAYLLSALIACYMIYANHVPLN